MVSTYRDIISALCTDLIGVVPVHRSYSEMKLSFGTGAEHTSFITRFHCGIWGIKGVRSCLSDPNEGIPLPLRSTGYRRSLDTSYIYLKVGPVN